MKNLLILALLTATQLCAGYQYCGTVTFPGATASLSSINLFFAFSDSRFAGLHTVSRNSLTVPTDLIVTDDSTCQTQTGGYTWDVEAYDSSAGSGWVKVLVSMTTSAKTVYVGFDNPSVTTYQGGSVGSAYDASTKLVASFNVDTGGTLSYVDSSASACNGVPTGTSATTGQIDGGVAMATNDKVGWGGTTCGSAGTGSNGALDIIPATTGWTASGWAT